MRIKVENGARERSEKESTNELTININCFCFEGKNLVHVLNFVFEE